MASFILENNIKKVINLRTIGRRFEGDYYKFKDWLHGVNSNVDFYDTETLREIEKINVNIRNIILSILKRALKNDFTSDQLLLKSVFNLKEKTDSIAINMHSRGSFKLWEISKWVNLILYLIKSDSKIRIYEGINQEEKSYTQEVIRNLPVSLASKVEILQPKNLYDASQLLTRSSLLISVDSGYIHLADAIGLYSLGIYITTSPIMWGGVTKKFHYINSEHLFDCKNYYPYFGMCMNNKRKCDAISSGRNDISVESVIGKINQINYEKEN